jgi:ribosomal protection tetracycline resistance protein
VRTLNLGIVAHVDAGKTSLTERLLYNAGVIGEIGRVDDGNTTTDSLALERQRGITIKSAVVSFTIGDVTVNLIDTPGHPDFIAEVERVLSVLDGAVLVVSAVEGVQPQTRILMRTLRRLGIPTVIFINKTDRTGADPGRVLRAIRDKLTPAAVAVESAGGVAEALAEVDDSFLAAYVSGTPVEPGRVRAALAAHARRGTVFPVLSGSALTGATVPELADAITEFLPCSPGSPDAPLDGTVFKIERGAAGEKIAYVRLFAGTLRVRDRVRLGGTGDDGGRGERGGRAVGREAKVTAVGATSGERDTAAAGQIARVRGPHDIRIGDAVRHADGDLPERKEAAGIFAPPTLETAVVPASAADRIALHSALAQLAEQDPLIGLRRDGERLFISLYGEVQKEVIEAMLASDFGLAVGFEETTTICVERPAGTGESAERMKMSGNPFLATVGLKVSPLPGDQVEFRLGVSPGDMPPAFFAAVEDTVHETLRQGLRGWQVAGALVTMTLCGYAPRQSHAHQKFDKSMSSTGADFRGLTPLVVMKALRRAGTAVYEPLHRFLLDLPSERIEPALTALPRFAAIPLTTTAARGGSSVVEGEIPAARIRDLQRELPGLTSGEGVLETSFDRYARVRDAVPSRPRTGPDPLNRKEYLLRVNRRV